MNKLPALQFYVGDWRKDPGVQALSYEERGIWLELLFLMHESEHRGKLLLNGNPITNERLANILHLDEEKINKTINTLLTLGVARLCPETGALVSRRMLRDEAIREERSRAGQAGGGNPAFSKGKPNPYYKQEDKQEGKQKINGSINNQDKQKIDSSSSSSSSKEEEERHVRRTSSRPPASDSMTVKKLIEMYDAMKPDECPPSKTITDSRTKQYARYVKQFPKESYWETVFSQMCQSLFLRGLESWGDRPPVARGLDWLCKLGADDRIENCQKTYEGNYRSTPQGQLPLNGEWYPDDPTNPLSSDPE